MMLLLIAIILMALIAWVALRAAELDAPRDRTPTTRSEVNAAGAGSSQRSATAVVEDPDLQPQTVVVETSPDDAASVPMSEHVEMGVRPALLGERQVLVRIGVPHPQPDPDRLIQTEILLPDDARARSLAGLRLIVGVLGFGVTFGLGIVLFVRWLGALLS